jgi:hypothetical protein
MPSFTFYITDSRFRPRHAFYATAANRKQAKARATEVLFLSQYYVDILVYRRGKYLFSLTKDRPDLGDEGA